MREQATAKDARQQIEAALEGVRTIAVTTTAGDSIRSRLMPFALGQDLEVYVALAKGDPRAMLIAFNPAVSLLAVDETPGAGRAKGGGDLRQGVSGKGCR